MKSISHNIALAALGRVVVNVLGLFVVGILTRTLGPDGYGRYSTIFAYLFVVAIIADMGLYTLLVREISRDGADEARITSDIVSLRFVLLVVVSCVAIAVVWLLPYPPSVQWGVVIGSLSMICSSLTQVLMGVFQKHVQLYLVTVAEVVTKIVQLAAVVLLAMRGTTELWAYIGTIVVAEMVHIGMIGWFSRRLTPWKFRLDVTYWKVAVREALPIAISLVFVLMYFKLDTVMLSLMKPPYDVGVYSVAYKVLEIIIFFPAMYVGLIMPILSKSAPHRTDFIREYQKAFDVLAIFAVPAIMCIGIMATPIAVLLGGAAYHQAGPVLSILSIAIGLIFFGNLGGNALIALNLQKRAMWIYAIGAVVNVGLNFFLIPRYSYYAAAWTTVATELLVTVLMFHLIGQNLAYKFSWAVCMKAIAAAVITGIFMYPFAHSLVIGTVISLAYFPILYLLKGFSIDQLRAVVSGRA